MVDFLLWSSVVLGVLGAIANIYKKWWCFILWTLSNLILIEHNYHREELSQAALFVVYQVLCIIGLITWYKEKKHMNELGRGKKLCLVSDDNGYEYVERVDTEGVVVGLLGVTEKDELVLVEQFRPAVNMNVISLPAGCVGDEDPNEQLSAAVVRELLEESGYEPRDVSFMFKSPTSSGIANEMMYVYLGTGLRKVHSGGGTEGENIRVHVVPLSELHSWIVDQQNKSKVVSDTVYAALYFAAAQKG